MGFYQKYTDIIDSYSLFSSLFDSLDGSNNQGNATSWFSRVCYYKDTQNLYAVFKSTSNVDSYLLTDSTQTYYITFQATITGGTTGSSGVQGTLTKMVMYVGTDKQIVLAKTNPTTTMPTLDPTLTQYVIWQATSDTQDLSINFTSRGFSFVITTIHTINRKEQNSLVCIQRPVNPLTGAVNLSGSCPIFALVQNVTDNTDNGLNFFVVREQDIHTSSYPVSTYKVVAPSGSSNSTYIPGILYKTSFDWVHPVMFDDTSYVIKFPFGFISSRNVYLDEMDLIGFVNATVFPSQTDLNLTLYNEATQRTYTTRYGPSLYGYLDTTAKPYKFSTSVRSSSRLCQLKASG